MAGIRVVVKMLGPDSLPRRFLSLSPAPGGGAGRAPVLRVPRISRSVRETRSTFPSRTRERNLLGGISTARGATSHPWTTNRTVRAMKR